MNLYQILEQFNSISHLLEQNQHIIIFEIIDVSQWLNHNSKNFHQVTIWNLYSISRTYNCLEFSYIFFRNWLI